MAKAEFGTAKFLSKQMKAKGLQKLKFYCQVCHKQCRDENGFRSHIKAPSHLQKISQITAEDINNYTTEFERNFLRLLKLNHGEKKIEANKFYNEFIQDKEHIHMNSTNFTSLSKFIQYLSRNGKIRIYGLENLDDTDDNVDLGQLMISYIDNSSETILRKQKIDELSNIEKSHQEVSTVLLQNQIAKGSTMVQIDERQEEQDVVGNQPVLQLQPGEKISLTLTGNGITKNKKKKTTLKKKSVFKS
ncbi:hypothetical protein NCAS_0G00380 [Naumovozyma castellii]|uniref:C2H2-type domain-containing protein n=1 Tax=Naumovozyma castellii TaxID=27288 RepID=G0VHP1_NAUCA|nr:hypothetical protein NCAS_0G00380 [Naumovozyma castellii CBS 4309]CCC70925.1 hypothetical protein NCAS_0G00380 [Naumovozyma castellii CBS 4309]